MATKTKGLGRGFDTLLPTNFDTSIIDETERIKKLPIDKVKANPDQPRTHFDQGALSGLADSIREHGILQPLIVTSVGDEYLIIAGERRWRAAQLAGLQTVPAIVRTSKELEQLEVALVENVQRVDLSPLEQAVSIQRLHDQFSRSYESIAKRLGKALSTVHNIVRLLHLPPSAAEALKQGVITEGHARSILALKDMPDKQAELLRLITERSWSVRQAEQFVVSCKSGAKQASEAVIRTQSETPLTKKVAQVLDTKVTIKHMAKGGRLLIHFRSDTDLERITDRLKSLS